MALPLAVWVGLNEPHAPALPHVTDQSTPVFDESFETSAVIIAAAFVSIPAGGALWKETEMGTGVIVIFAETDFDLSAVEVAITVTALLLGTVRGAVNVMVPPLAV